MKIIDNVNLRPAKKATVTCSSCTSTMEVTRADATKECHDQRDGSYYVIPCGVCRHEMFIDYNLLKR
jgi:hypothetical protein